MLDPNSLHSRDPKLVRRLVEVLERPLWAWFRPTIKGLDRIPDGAGLYVGNHSGTTLSPDSFVFGIAAYRAHGIRAVPYGLAHDLAVDFPGFRHVLVPLGAVRASHDNARAIFAADAKAIVYPGGDLDAYRPFSRRNEIIFGARRGYIKLALRSDVPIVPIVSAGSHATLFVLNDGRWLAEKTGIAKMFRIKTLPLTFSLPYGLTVGPTPPYFPLPSQISIEVMPPIRFDRSGDAAAGDVDYVEACHQRVHSSMQRTLTRLAKERKRRRHRFFR